MSRKALLVVDMLKDFMPESVYPGAKLPVEPADEIVGPIKEAVRRARRENVPVFYLNDTHDKKDKEFEDWPEHCVKGTEGAEVIDELEPQEKDVVIQKKTYSGFSNPRLEEELEARGIEQVYVVGVVTSTCVLETAKEALKRGYEAKVIRECVSGLESQEDGLKDLGEAGVKVVEKNKFLGE